MCPYGICELEHSVAGVWFGLVWFGLVWFSSAYISRTTVQVQFGSASESVHKKKKSLFFSAGNSVSSSFDKTVQVPPQLRTELHSVISFWKKNQTKRNI